MMFSRPRRIGRPRRWWINKLHNKWARAFGPMKRAHRALLRMNNLPPVAADAFWRPFFTRVR